MKSIVILSAFIILSCICLPIVSADPAIIISSYSMSPSVLYPGDEALLTITVYNAETTATHTSAAATSTSSSTTDMVGADIENVWINSEYDSEGKRVSAVKTYPDLDSLSEHIRTNLLKDDYKWEHFFETENLVA